MVSRLVRGAVNLARSIEYSVQSRSAVLVSFELPLPLTGLGATESGVDRHVFGIFSVALTLVFIASGPAVSVLCFRSARIAGTVAATGKPSIFACAKAGHE